MTSFKHPVYPTVQFDVVKDSMFLNVDGDVRHMFDAEEVGRLMSLIDHATSAQSDLDEFFRGLGEPDWVAVAAAELFITSANEIERIVNGETT